METETKRCGKVSQKKYERPVRYDLGVNNYLICERPAGHTGRCAIYISRNPQGDPKYFMPATRQPRHA
jgi:hypothetical protein